MENVLPIIEENYEMILQSAQDSYGVDKKAAEKIYRHLWIYTHGIASLCATKTCSFTPIELSSMLTDILTAVLKEVKR